MHAVTDENIQDFGRTWQLLAIFDHFSCLMFLRINDYKKVGEITLLTLYQIAWSNWLTVSKVMSSEREVQSLK
jgi:hypothetical protein